MGCDIISIGFDIEGYRKKLAELRDFTERKATECVWTTVGACYESMSGAYQQALDLIDEFSTSKNQKTK